ncbi:MAG: hypothetical protein ACPG44_09200, partial [Polaribacter sp.]
MKQHVITFQLFEKKFRTKIKASNHEELSKKLKDFILKNIKVTNVHTLTATEEINALGEELETFLK